MRFLIILTGVLGFGLAQVAPAQEASRQDVRALTGCVQERAQSYGMSTATAQCVGSLSRGCNRMPTVDHAACLMDEFRAWDVLLNTWWQPMRANAKAAGTWDALLRSQRAWIAEKEARCDAAYRSGGSLGQIAAAECLRDRTGAQAIAFYYALYK